MDYLNFVHCRTEDHLWGRMFPVSSKQVDFGSYSLSPSHFLSSPLHSFSPFLNKLCLRVSITRFSTCACYASLSVSKIALLKNDLPLAHCDWRASGFFMATALCYSIDANKVTAMLVPSTLYLRHLDSYIRSLGAVIILFEIEFVWNSNPRGCILVSYLVGFLVISVGL